MLYNMLYYIHTNMLRRCCREFVLLYVEAMLDYIIYVCIIWFVLLYVEFDIYIYIYIYYLYMYTHMYDMNKNNKFSMLIIIIMIAIMKHVN